MEFSDEIETNKNINYLNLTLKFSKTNNIQIGIYWKLSSNTIAIRKNARHSQQQKLFIFNSLVHRVTNLPIISKKEDELSHMRRISQENDFHNITITNSIQDPTKFNKTNQET
jgi:hypothetical protein